MPENQPGSGPESELNSKDLYFRPHMIDEEIRNLKKEYCNTQKLPGAERKIELQEKYEELKSERYRVRTTILNHLEKYEEGKRRLLENFTENMSNAQRDFERGQTDDNPILLKQAKDRWQLINDTYQLLDRNEDYWHDMELADEDEGLELGELKNPQ